MNPVVENKKAMVRMRAKVWRLYMQIPPGRKKQAQELIDEWHYGKRSYESLLEELRKLAAPARPGRKPGRKR